MDAILRAAAIYLLLLVILRVSGKRTMAQLTVFDFVLLLVLSEATQQALLGDDFSVTNAALVILTLVTLERASDYIAWRSRRFDRLVNDGALVLMEDGVPNVERMHRARVTADDVLEQARIGQGIERLEQIKYAVLERSGDIGDPKAERLTAQRRERRPACPPVRRSSRARSSARRRRCSAPTRRPSTARTSSTTASSARTGRLGRR